jgi:hypothetical protein
MATATQTQEISVYYLDRLERYKTEKPYEIRFDVPADFPTRNSVMSKYEGIKAEDIRGREAEFSVERNGFDVLHLDVPISYEDFADRETLISAYFPRVAAAVKDRLGASRVQVHDWLVSAAREEHCDSGLTGQGAQESRDIPHIDWRRV